MKKMIAILLCVYLVFCSAVSLAEAAIRVGISWSCDFEYGIPDEHTLAYIDSVMRAGGEPVYLPQITDEASALAALQSVDCVILTGGEDLNPALYGAEKSEFLQTVNDIRDTSDMLLAKAALDTDVPMLATCRGLQLINVLFGGTLVQDIPSELDSAVYHRDPAGKDFAFHTLTILDPESLVAIALDAAETLEVNSWHHQCVKTVGEGLVVTAVSEDGVVEALEMADPDQFMLAVQFHPEWHVEGGNDAFLPFFQMLMDSAEMNRAAA